MQSEEMASFSEAKQLVRSYYRALDTAPPEAISGVMADYCSADYLWRGFHPFNEQHGPEAVARSFWRPLRHALPRTQRRIDVFLAGHNEMDGFQSTWVVSMGHLMGLFDFAWLGIPPTGKMTFLRYC